jgi:hypothetical protein
MLKPHSISSCQPSSVAGVVNTSLHWQAQELSTPVVVHTSLWCVRWVLLALVGSHLFIVDCACMPNALGYSGVHTVCEGDVFGSVQ